MQCVRCKQDGARITVIDEQHNKTMYHINCYGEIAQELIDAWMTGPRRSALVKEDTTDG